MSIETELALIDSSEDVVRLQKEQLFAGESSDDTPIFNIKTGSEYYSDSYARYKGKDHPIDLKDKSNFYNGIYAKPESEGLLIYSDDQKTEKLVGDYGEEIFGLGEQSSTELVPISGAKLVNNLEIQLNEP